MTHTKTCKDCIYFIKDDNICIALPPRIIYHDTLKIRDTKTGKVLQTKAPNILNINPNVSPDRKGCVYYEQG